MNQIRCLRMFRGARLWRRMRYILSAQLLVAVVACNGSGGGGETDPATPPPQPPTGTPTVSMDREAGTVTIAWAAEAGKSYKIYYSYSPITSSVQGASAVTGGPFDSSPQTVSLTPNLGEVFFAVTAVKGSQESAPSSAASTYVLGQPAFDFSGSPSATRQAGGSALLAWTMSPSYTGTDYKIYVTTSADSTPVLVDTVAQGDLLSTSHAFASYLNGSGAALTYNFYIVPQWSDGTQISRGIPSPTWSVTPALSGFSLYPVSGGSSPRLEKSSDFDRGAIALAGAKLYWRCSAGFVVCTKAKTAYDGSAIDGHTLAANPFTAFTIEADESNIYYVDKPNNAIGRYVVASKSSSSLNASISPVGIVHDATNVYAAGATSIVQVTKSEFDAGTPSAYTPLVSSYTGIQAMVVDSANGKLYIGHAGGVDALSVPGGTTPTVLSSSYTNVTSLALEGSNLYFISDDPLRSGLQNLYKIDLTQGSPTVAEVKSGLTLYGASQLVVKNGNLHWRNQNHIFSLAADLTLETRVAGVTTSGLAADGEGYLYFGLSSNYYPHRLPIEWASAAPSIPAAPSNFGVTATDEGGILSWDSVDDADVYQVFADSAYMTTVVSNGSSVSALSNGRNYTMDVIPVNITGAGVAGSVSLTPKVAAPTVVEAAPADGEVKLSLRLYHPSARTVDIKIYRSTTTPVDTSAGATPVYTHSMTAAGEGTITDTVWDGSGPGSPNTATTVSNGTLYFYNVVATMSTTDGAGTHLSTSVAGEEKYGNGAPTLTVLDATYGPSVTDKAGLVAIGSTLYFGNGAAIVEYDTVGPSFTNHTLSGNSVHLLAVDGADLFSGTTMSSGIQKITGLASIPTASSFVTAAEFTGMATVQDLINGGDGYLYASTYDSAGGGDNNVARIDSTDTGNASSSGEILHAGGSSATACSLTVAFGKLYWAERSNQNCTHPSTVSATGIKSRDLSTGEVTSISSETNAYPAMELQAYGSHLYWNTGSGNVYRTPLAGGAVETLIGDYRGGAFAFDGSGTLFVNYSGALYYQNVDGRLVAHSLTGNTSVTGLKYLNGSMYLYGNGELYGVAP